MARRTRHDCDRCVSLSKEDGRTVELGAGRYRPLIDQWICGPCYPLALVAARQRQIVDIEQQERALPYV
jgi:hypothetical protein